MDTTLVPLNVAQFQNSLTFMGEYMSPFFSALWPLAAISIAIGLTAIVLVFVGNLLIWLAEYVTNINFFNIRNKYDIKNDYNISNKYSGGGGGGGGTPQRKGVYTITSGPDKGKQIIA